jgi:hypothetical protein
MTMRPSLLLSAGPLLFASLGVLVAAACSSSSSNPLTTSGAGAANTTNAATGTGGDVFLASGSGGSGEACAKSVTEGKLKPANILFVLDRSGSMNCNAPPLQTSTSCELNPVTKDPTQPTKWEIVAAALKQALATMPLTTNVGISYFSTDSACGVSQAPAVPLAPLTEGQRTVLEASIDAVMPKGATPIVGATTLGYKHLHEDVSLPGKPFVVLLTDGAETCAPELQEKLVSVTVPLAKSLSIRTFVIGAPGSDPARALLSRIAWEGGTPADPLCKHDAAPNNVGDCHFDMTDPSLDFAAELAKALSAISGTALSCELDVPGGVGVEVDFDKVNVTFTPTMGKDVGLFQDNQSCDNANGWQYNADKTKIVLCGKACDQVKADSGGKITIELGCSTMVAQ